MQGSTTIKGHSAGPFNHSSFLKQGYMTISQDLICTCICTMWYATAVLHPTHSTHNCLTQKLLKAGCERRNMSHRSQNRCPHRCRQAVYSSVPFLCNQRLIFGILPCLIANTSVHFLEGLNSFRSGGRTSAAALELSAMWSSVAKRAWDRQRGSRIVTAAAANLWSP